MENLELKHLAAYLPYELRVKILNYKYDCTGEQFGVLSGYYFYDGIPHFHMNQNRTQAGKDISLFVPILRPLSDLTKEIEVNGEKFIPIEKISPVSNFFNVDFLIKTPLASSFEVVIKLLELHFDVFGLIDKGLAIDINTLSNE